MSGRKKQTEHASFYKGNKQYEKFLSKIDDSLYSKYIKFLTTKDLKKRIKVLDLGCGVGTVIHKIDGINNIKGYGVDVSGNFISNAKKGRGIFKKYDGKKIPYANESFDVVGCFTVLEHVNNPKDLITEMVRVLKKDGLIVIGAPSFLRVFGFSATHYRTRGIGNSLKNLFIILNKFFYVLFKPNKMSFSFMKPVKNNKDFHADDDAICITNLIDVRFVLKKSGIRIKYQSGLVDFNKHTFWNIFSELPIIRDMTGGFFVSGIK